MVVLFELIAFYFSALLRLTVLLSAEGGALGFTLNSTSSSPDPELSFRSLDWHLLMILHAKGAWFYWPVNAASLVCAGISTVWDQ